MKELIQRLQNPTPKFFNRLAWIGGVLTTVGTALTLWPVALPPVLITIGSHLIAGGTTIIAVSKLTVKNPENLNQ